MKEEGSNGEESPTATHSEAKDTDDKIYRLRRINVYDKVLNIISIILGILTLFLISVFVSIQRLTKKITEFVNLSVSVVLLSFNIVVCFGQLFFSPAQNNTSGCIAIAFLQHFLISALFTITTWGSILIFFAILRTIGSSITALRFLSTITSSYKSVIIQAVVLILISLFFPVLFVSIAKSKNSLYSVEIGEENLSSSRFAYLQTTYITALDDNVCFIHDKGTAFKTLMYGQWSVAMFFASIHSSYIKNF